MNELPCGERVVRCLLGQSIDRVPFGVGLGWIPWGDAAERWQQQSGRPHLDLRREFSFDASFALPAIEYGPWPHFKSEVLEETAEFIVARDWRGIIARNRRDRASMPEFLEHPVKTPAEWEKFKHERLRIEDATRLREDWAAFRARLQRTGEAVQVGSFPWGMFGTVRDLLGAERVLYAFYDHPEMIWDMMDHLTTLWLRQWEQVAAHFRIDHIHVWEDMSGKQGPLISPTMIEQFMMPCYDRIAEFAHTHGVRLLSVDTDGDCSALAPILMKHGVNVMFPFEVQAGNDILAYRSRYPPLGILGGLDKRALANSRQDVDREVQRCNAMVKLGRYVPGFDHLIPPDARWENVRYAAERIKEICWRN
jgi:uroporphyrinogen decarboxylase